MRTGLYTGSGALRPGRGFCYFETSRSSVSASTICASSAAAISRLTPKGSEAVLLRIQLRDVPFDQLLLLGGAFERLHVLADAALVLTDTTDLGLTHPEIGGQRRDGDLLREDRCERLRQRFVLARATDEDRPPAVVELGDLVTGLEGVDPDDVERRVLLGVDRDGKPVRVRRRFRGLQVRGERPSRTNRVLDDDRPRCVVVVANRVDAL